ncbi:MAG: DUF2442 domain-containing protein [Campylobacterales bacterium]|nr:DUF2442 domain-containing protein [Campylobacterales bacterium]
MLLDIVNFDYLDGYKLLLTFENGEIKEFDCSTIMNEKPFKVLRDINYFKCAKIDYGTLVWPNEIDIAPETLYIDSKSVSK